MESSKIVNIAGKNYFYEISDGKPGFMIEVVKRLAMVETSFQMLEVFQTNGYGNLMTLDGCTMVSTFENHFYHEMISHPAIFSHPNPKDVCIIGGGDCGTLKEVLKHKSIRSVIQVDIDKLVTDMSLLFFPELCSSNNDPRASLLFDDGIKWMENAPDASMDIIIVDSTDPAGPALGLFNEKFYNNCFRVLKEDGIIVQQSESPLIHIDLQNDIRSIMRESGFKNITMSVFPQSIYPSGWWSVTMASKSDYVFSKDLLINKDFETRYYNADIHFSTQTSSVDMLNQLK
ncbi:MAG: polyamine aminopropyltransferase [Candidatus Gracilibacteria bacterium]|nr:polyamine aminopropyltransferase [Candidatus Gracilibacteria bacterium]MDP3381578.1 polyamine aminopropyltransferase [bacterium]